MKKILLLTALFLATAALFAQKKESLAVFAFTGGNVSDGEAIASSLTRQAALRNAFNKTTLITRNTIAAMNFEQRFQRNSGLTDADTIFELGKQLNASHVIAGYITRFGDRNLVLVSIMDVESLQQIAGDYRTYRSIEEIDALIPAIAQKLAAAVPRNTANLPGLSVPPFNIAGGVNQNDAMVLAQILACDLANGSKYAVLPRTDSVEAVLAEHQRQRDGTTDQERVRRLGAGRNARYVLSGSVQRLGTLNKFATDILDIEDGNFLDGHEEQYTNFSQGFELIPKLAARLNGFSVTVNSAEAFTKAITDINAAGPGMYTVTLTGSITVEGISLRGSGNGLKTVIIQGDSTMRTVTQNFSNLFAVPADCMLILGNNATLNGNSKDSYVVGVSNGGIFEMQNGSVITGSGSYGVYVQGGTFTMSGGTIRNNKGGGVYVGNGTFTMNDGTISGNTARGVVVGNNGTFTMSGGTISGNTVSGDDCSGGGVYVYRGTFTMSGGAISGNTVSGIYCSGGGVAVLSGIFTMSGGTISGNTASSSSSYSVGGGVYVSNGTFTMSGGTISGNFAAGVSSCYGGGVYVGSSSNGTFTKTGGTVTGYAGDTNNGNVVRDSSRTVQSNRGHAVYVDGGGKRRESTAGPNVNLDSTKGGAAGGWE